MATVSIIAGLSNGGGRPASSMLYIAGSTRARESVTSSASNDVLEVIGNTGETVIVCCASGAIKLAIAVGANPDATTAYDFIIGDGGSREVFCRYGDTRFAIVDV